ncbi:MAG: GIY-YIG nuclease family protein [Lysobacteraceae bacterium]
MLASLEPTSLVRSIPNETAGESDGFVYLIKSGRHFKIGRSNAFGRREREIALQLPEAAKTLHVIRTDDPVGIEAYWHKRFADKRKNGEWFELKQSDVSAFKRRKFM